MRNQVNKPRLSDQQIDYLFAELSKTFGQGWQERVPANDPTIDPRQRWGVGALGMSRVEIIGALRACGDLLTPPTPEEFRALGVKASNDSVEEFKTQVKSFVDSIREPDCLPNHSEHKTDQVIVSNALIPVNMSSPHGLKQPPEKPNDLPEKSLASQEIYEENMSKIRNIIDGMKQKDKKREPLL